MGMGLLCKILAVMVEEIFFFSFVSIMGHILMGGRRGVWWV